MRRIAFPIALLLIASLGCSEDGSDSQSDAQTVSDDDVLPEPTGGTEPEGTPDDDGADDDAVANDDDGPPADDDVAPTPAEPTVEPGPQPSPGPTVEPSPGPTVEPTPEPGAEPVPDPTVEPSPEPVDAGSDAGPPIESLEGVCGARADGVVTVDDFAGYEEFYIIGDEGFGEDVCIVRFDLVRVGEAPTGCVDLDGQACLWTHLLEYANPEVLLDEHGACANSALGLDDEGIAALEGSQVAYGYVFEYEGHNSVVLEYLQSTGTWEPDGNANWNEETGDFRFDDRNGICPYEGVAP